MKGTRPLDNGEILRVSVCFGGIFAARNRGLFMLGVSTGGRISELLSLQIGDVYQNGRPVTDLLYSKSIVKGGEVSRAVPVNRDGRQAIDDLIGWHIDYYGMTENVGKVGFCNEVAEGKRHCPQTEEWAMPRLFRDRPLFPSRNGQGTKGMSRRNAHDVLKAAFEAAGLNGHLATHSLRKSFAQRLYDQTGDIFAVQEMLGHRNVATTQKYLGVNYASVREALEEMSVLREDSELHTITLLGSSLKKETDDTLFMELALRGYNLSRLRDTDEKTGEIVKIG